MKKFLIIVVFVIIGMDHFLIADERLFYPGNSEYKFDNIKIVQTIELDSSQLPYGRKFILDFYIDNKLEAKYLNINVQAIFRSPDKNYFVGLSNDGMPGTAYVVFDKRGNLLREIKHECLDFVDYCTYSITINRTWVNLKKPDLKVLKGSLGVIIQVTGCNGRKYNLLNKGGWGEPLFYYYKKDSLENIYNNIYVEGSDLEKIKSRTNKESLKRQTKKNK